MDLRNCNCELKEDECEIVDNLIGLEKNLSTKTTSSLVYIAGCVHKGTKEINDTTHYCENSSDFINVLNHQEAWSFHQIVVFSWLFSVISCLHSLQMTSLNHFSPSNLWAFLWNIPYNTTEAWYKICWHLYQELFYLENSKKHKGIHPESTEIILKLSC